MRIEIVEESHNRVDWEAKSPLLWIEAGVLLAVLAFALVIVLSPLARRWLVVGAAGATGLTIAAIVAVTTPLVEKGHLERLPEGGDVGWAQVWPLVGERARSTAALEAIERFEVETELFEDTAPELYRRSRVWAVSDEGERYPLSSWAEASSALALGEALAKAGRRPLEVG